MTKKVLIIAYYFPPVGEGGVQRTAKFVKYLPELEWEPVVLTVKERIYRKTNRVIDVSLLKEIPKSVHVIRTKCIDLANISKRVKADSVSNSSNVSLKMLMNKIGGLLINPDAQMFWIPIATTVGLKLINQHKIDIIYSTGNPWSDHIIGAILNIVTRLPWVVDYRDPWNLNPYLTHSSKIRENLQLFLEASVIKHANKVIFTTERTKKDYERVFGDGKFVIIRNSFDPLDFESVKPKRFQKFTIVYSGSMQHYRGPYYFISGLWNWLKRCPQARQELQINILGKINEEAKTLIDKLGLQDVMNLIGYVSHKESIAYLLGADVLLSIVDVGGETIIPGKIFEYFASGKPILALIPPSGSAACILRKEGREKYIVSPRDVESIEDRLNSLYSKYKKGCLPIYPVDNLQLYTRKRACENLSELFNNLKH
ncbi:glycosyltransferase [candidate division WOR-3 bacterium]|nr:glycosyltransferase [candidate division WOR-3 bacterium]